MSEMSELSLNGTQNANGVVEGDKEESPELRVEADAKSWVNSFQSNEKKNPNYKKRLDDQVSFWSSYFKDEYYDKFVCNQSSLGFLCRALAENLASVDQTTEFGKKWANLVKVNVELLEKLEQLHNDCDPGDVDFEYGGRSDVDLYLEIFVDRRNPPRNGGRKDRHGSAHLTDASVLTLVKEILQRVRFFSRAIRRRKLQSQYTMAFSDSVRYVTDWLPDYVERKIQYEYDGKKRERTITEEPFFHVCLNYLRAAQAAQRLNKHRNATDGQSTGTRRDSRKNSRRSNSTRRGNMSGSKNHSNTRSGSKQFRGKSQQKNQVDNSETTVSSKNDAPKRVPHKPAKTPSKNAWEERRKDTLRQQLAEYQAELQKLESTKKPSAEVNDESSVPQEPKEENIETIEDVIADVVGEAHE